VVTAIGSGSAFARSTAVQSDGRILAAGSSTSSDGYYTFTLARYRNGTLDASFGGTGQVTTSFGDISAFAYSAAVQADGRIVAAGTAGSAFALARYSSTGTLDTTFGGTGEVTTSFDGYTERAYGVAIQADGRIVAAGYTYANGVGYKFAVARYNSDGSLDNSFGISGRVTTSFGGSGAWADSVTLQADGRIVAAGYASDGGGYKFALARYNSDGTLDTSLGTGVVTTSFGGGAAAFAYAVAVQTDGRIVAAGFTNNGAASSTRWLGTTATGAWTHRSAGPAWSRPPSAVRLMAWQCRPTDESSPPGAARAGSGWRGTTATAAVTSRSAAAAWSPPRSGAMTIGLKRWRCRAADGSSPPATP
jgi:uncharacterized delta-60 repeat protein